MITILLELNCKEVKLTDHRLRIKEQNGSLIVYNADNENNDIHYIFGPKTWYSAVFSFDKKKENDKEIEHSLKEERVTSSTKDHSLVFPGLYSP
jgi:hypothetical protein